MPNPENGKPEKPTKKEKQDHTAKQVQHFLSKIAKAQEEIDAMVLAGFIIGGDPSMQLEQQERYDELVASQVAWSRHIEKLLGCTVEEQGPGPGPGTPV